MMHDPSVHPMHAAFPDLDPLSGQALHEFKKATMLHRRLLGAVLAGDELMHPAQAGCVQVLSTRDGIGQSELADALHVSRPTVTTMLQRMEASGMVERRADEIDSRITRVYLTDEGRRRAEKMRTAFREVTDLSVGRLSEDDRREFIRILGLLNRQVAQTLQERGVSMTHHHHMHDHEEG